MDQWLRLPLGNWVDAFVTFLLDEFRGGFRLISKWVGAYVGLVETVLTTWPFWLTILLIVIITYRAAGRGAAIFAALGLLLVSSLGLWDRAMASLALVITATLVSMLIGVPLGILAARSRALDAILRPLLDLMQTMPSFVYLIPALMFFGIGEVPGVIATVVFSMPPAIRLTNLGIRQVPEQLTDAARSFGATPAQTLFGVQLPLAMPTIMAGVNQTIMLSLSMVVIAAMIGAGGLGGVVLTAIQRVQIGQGFEGGIAIVVFAIILDRTTQALADSSKGRRPASRAVRLATRVVGGAAILFLLVSALFGTGADTTKTIRIAMPPWTTSPPPTYIAKAMLEDLGLRVVVDETDIGVAYQALAAGDVDLLVDAWMPNLHANYFETYGDRLDIIGEPLYTGARLGWAVPEYVPVDSVVQLNDHKDQFRGRVIGIDPGASMMRVSQEIIDAYNLDFELLEGSEFAMLAALGDAIRAKEWIVFLAWQPHFMFIQHDIKFLDEPRDMWTEDYIVKVSRVGFADDFPEAARLLARWTMSVDELDGMVHAIEVQNRPPDEVGREWVHANQDRIIDGWLEQAR